MVYCPLVNARGKGTSSSFVVVRCKPGVARGDDGTARAAQGDPGEPKLHAFRKVQPQNAGSRSYDHTGRRSGLEQMGMSIRRAAAAEGQGQCQT